MFTALGRNVIGFFTDWGSITLVSITVFKALFRKKTYSRAIHHMLKLGLDSLPVTIITALFVGMAFSIQVVREFMRFGAPNLIGGVIGLAIWRELGPLLTGVVVAGRAGAAISAELGTMTVTEQVEALESMSQDPAKYLVAPRTLACTLMLPLLVGIADIVGFLGGFIIAVSSGVNAYAYFDSANRMLSMGDISGGLGKALVFGFVIAVISATMGLQAKGGAKGVGVVTTKAVVVSLITVFILNFVISVSMGR